VRRLAALAVALGLAGCGSSGGSAPSTGSGGNCSTSTSFPVQTIATVATDSGKLQIAIRSAPYEPIEAGLSCIELVVTDASSGAGVDGLSMTMTPWMPSMGHGADTTPTLTALGQGHYVFTDVSLFMPGEWQLRTQISGAASDSAEPTLNVE
jgi:hypothetical protein